MVQRVVPEGWRRAKHTDEVIAALEAHPGYEVARADRRSGLRRCVEALISAADWASMTARPTWDRLAAVLGVARRSVARYLEQLRDMGLVAVVASGRSAAYASVGEDGRRVNEAAVYVLCVPEEKPAGLGERLRALVGRNRGDVDESVTPPSEAGNYLLEKERSPRTRAREGGSKSTEEKRLGLSADQIRWNRHRVPAGRRQQQTAAWRLGRMLPNVLGKMTPAAIASVVRDFFNAGWSPADLHYALESQPDGRPWPYSGAPDTKEPHRVRGWLRFRLAAWRDEHGTPITSRDQAERAARKAAEEARAAERAQQAARPTPARDSETKRRALARIRARLGGAS